MKKTSKSKVVSIIFTVSLFVIMLAAVGFYFVRIQDTARAKLLDQVDTTKVGNIPEIVNSTEEVVESTEQMEETSFDVQAQTMGDVTVEVTYAKQIETGMEIGVCFTTLDDGEWYPGPGYLTYSDAKIPPDEFEFMEEVHANEKSTGTRCAAIRYRIDDVQAIVFPLQFEMRDVHMVPREMPVCQNLQHRLDTSPKAQEYGITINCTGGEQQSEMSVQLDDFNSSYTKAEAQVILDEIVAGKVSGPWEFTIDQIE